MTKAGQQTGRDVVDTGDFQPSIPDKEYFKISEVCEITGIKQHVLRYWETEFRILSPPRTRSKQRLYRKADVENVLKIKKLLKKEGFTISGAKKALARKKGEEPKSKASAAEFFKDIKQELLDLKKLLEGR